MFITAVCVIFLVKLRWPKNKSLYDTVNQSKTLATNPSSPRSGKMETFEAFRTGT